MKRCPTYKQYKVRELSWNKHGTVFGISIPREIAEKHKDISFTIEETANGIMFKSGLDLIQFKKEVKKYDVLDMKSG